MFETMSYYDDIAKMRKVITWQSRHSCGPMLLKKRNERKTKVSL